jgi:hypothetical protein
MSGLVLFFYINAYSFVLIFIKFINKTPLIFKYHLNLIAWPSMSLSFKDQCHIGIIHMPGLSLLLYRIKTNIMKLATKF